MQDPINEHIGSCGIQLTDEDGVIARSCSPFPTARILCARMLGLDRLWPRLFAPPFLALDQHQRSRLVDQVMGAFMLVRRDLFDQLNGFDQRFFVYFEDLDFAFRSARLGYGCFYLTDAQAVHAGCGSSRNARAKAMVCNLVSRIQYSRKHFSLLGGIAVLLGTLFLEPIARLVRAVCRRSSDDLRETTKAYADLWRQAALVVLNRGRDRVMSLCA
jgi:GT2 family glycosyltransferase